MQLEAFFMHIALMLTYAVHYLSALLIATYAIGILVFESEIQKRSPDSEEYIILSKRMFQFNRIVMFITVVLLLTGGFLGTPYFKAMMIWIYAKVGLFIALTALQGALASRAMKQRILSVESGTIDTQALAKAQKKINIFMTLQIGIVAIIFTLAYTKPF